MGIGVTKWATQACTIPNGTTMVVMFVGWLCWGRHYFPYYSYRRNPTGREFFVPAQTHSSGNVKLLSGENLLVTSLFRD